MNPIIRNIPNSITCLNLLAGCMSVIAASRGTSYLWGLPAYQWAFIFIAIGAAADFLDGLAARTLHAYSNLDKELDSLCDLVTFGVAPAMIIINLFLEHDPDSWTAWTALLIPVSGALRLARFNIDTRQATTFIGLPIPANALFWMGYAALFAGDNLDVMAVWYCFLPVLLLECWLMNSPVRIFSLKFKNLRFSDNYARFALIFAAVVLVGILGVSGLLALVVFYVILSLIAKEQ